VGAFSCNGCGGCCRRVKFLHPDWPTRADGACIHLTADNRCAIYATRPLVCRVDEMRPNHMSVELWHQINAESCAQFQTEDGLAQSL
jgi:Fe-S-cluster containining protein